MVKLGKYNIPTSWADVTLFQFEKLTETDDEFELIELLAGIDKETAKNLSEKNVYQINLLLNFMATPPDLSELKEPTKDITKETFGQKILAQQAEDVATLVAIYEMPKFDMDKLEFWIKVMKHKPLYYVVGKANEYRKRLKEVLEREAKELTVQPKSDHLRAGIDMFNEYGVMNTVKALAGGNILNYEKVLKLEYSVVYLHLKMSKTESIFQDNYSEVLKRKSKRG